MLLNIPPFVPPNDRLSWEPDCEEAKEELEELTTVNVKAIKTVSESLALKGYPRSNFSWPGDVYIEDINAESDLDLVKTIIKTVAKHGEL